MLLCMTSIYPTGYGFQVDKETANGQGSECESRMRMCLQANAHLKRRPGEGGCCGGAGGKANSHDHHQHPGAGSRERRRSGLLDGRFQD